MLSGTSLTRRAVLWSPLGLLLAGCGGPPETKPIESDEVGLREFAAIYRDFTRKNRRSPKSLKEVQVKGQGYPNAMQMMKSGELVVLWGSPLAADGQGADVVLAYLKTAPEQGGNVLMLDGKTIKKVTAEEFKAAPKADGR